MDSLPKLKRNDLFQSFPLLNYIIPPWQECLRTLLDVFGDSSKRIDVSITIILGRTPFEQITEVELVQFDFSQEFDEGCNIGNGAEHKTHFVNPGSVHLIPQQVTQLCTRTELATTRNDLEEVFEVLFAEIEAVVAFLVHPGTTPLLGQVQRRHGVSLQAAQDRGEHHNQHCQRTFHLASKHSVGS
jgi:hypothetical protein